MCGIVGLISREAPCDPAALDRMRDIVRHRGPDDAGSFIDGFLGLGHRRLSIIDLGGGRQPMSTPDGRFTIVYNGEVYNYVELRKELEAAGTAFRTSSDTEVILQLHAARGDAAVELLNGMFAYAIWDRVTKRLLIARDRAGIKPLYYTHGAQGFAFGSEIKTLFEAGMVRPRFNATHLAEYLLFRHVAGPHNLFEGVLALPPGHMMTVTTNGSSVPMPYWSPLDKSTSVRLGYKSAVDAVDSALHDSIRRQMMADVPLGTFCSGGVDSSLVTAIASRIAGHSINSFSVGFAEPGYDESGFARMASKHCRTQHHEIRIDEAQFADLLPKLIWHNDLPLNFANSVHIFAVSELARRHVKVVLTGEGADELFGGYPRYAIPRVIQLLSVIPQPARVYIARLLAKQPDHRLRRLGAFATRDAFDAIVYNCSTIDAQLVVDLISGGAAPPELAFRSRRAQNARARRLGALNAVARLDFETYLVSILNRQDKMSMAASLESRVPFLDNDMIGISHMLPQSFKQTLRYRKRVLKDVALRYLPRDIVERRKSGFGVPLREWLRRSGPVASLMQEVATRESITSVLDPLELARVMQEHRSGSRDHSDLLWGVLNLGLWRETFQC